jgi:anti-sigma B factor antagonist
MQLAERSEGQVLIVEVLESRIGGDVSEDFQSNMAQIIDRGNRWIVLDLSRVMFIDSMGLSGIIGSRIRLGKDGEMVICGLRAHVKNVFKFTRMDKVFRMFETPQEAAAALDRKETLDP